MGEIGPDMFHFGGMELVVATLEVNKEKNPLKAKRLLFEINMGKIGILEDSRKQIQES